ncbi:MAG: hypothetical protein KTR31_04220 [Myxococcales bacterium]|nr:hypothetical protein [Myxococcales bacterium]
MSEPPTEQEVLALAAFARRRTYVVFVDGAPCIDLIGPWGQRVMRFRVGPASGSSWTSVDLGGAILEFTSSLADLSDHVASTVVDPDRVVDEETDEIQDHIDKVRERFPDVSIEIVDVLSQEPGDWIW